MTRVLPNPPPPGDDLDVLLGNFFKGEMPAPWPEFRPPESARSLPMVGRSSPPRHRLPPRIILSRLALAASVALLLLAGLLLGGKLNPTRSQVLPTLTDPRANPRIRFPSVPVDPGGKGTVKAKKTDAGVDR